LRFHTGHAIDISPDTPLRFAAIEAAFSFADDYAFFISFDASIHYISLMLPLISSLIIYILRHLCH